MRRLTGVLFRRAEQVLISAAGGVYVRRGVIRPAQTLSGESEVRTAFGALETPLYIYTGDAAELLESAEACLYRDTEKYRVLEACAVEGFNGRAYVRAVLERQVEP